MRTIVRRLAFWLLRVCSRKPVMSHFDWNRHDEDMVRAINAAMAKNE